MTEHEQNNYCNYDASLALRGIGYKDTRKDLGFYRKILPTRTTMAIHY